MKGSRLARYCQNPSHILILILLVFFLKGVFLATIQPIFGGQDEARHYDTVQYLAEPTHIIPSEKDARPNDSGLRDKDDFDTYNFSEEIQRTASATHTDVLRGEIYNTIPFSDSSIGSNEPNILARTWKPYNFYQSPDVVRGSLYHKVTASIERLFASEDILTRFYTIRIFSVLLGTLAVFLTYQIATTIGFSTKISLILTALLAFQPKFSLYLTNINYDAFTIPAFFLFTYAGVLAIRYGLNWKNTALLVGSTLFAVLNKGTGLVLIVVFAVLISTLLFEKVNRQTKKIRYGIYGTCSVATISIIIFLFQRFLSINSSTTNIIETIPAYLDKTITFGRFVLPSSTYWGNLSWVNSALLGNVPNIILTVETAALVGLGLLLFSKKFKGDYPSFLPSKKYIVFLIGMIIALQIGVRIADWSVFSRLGSMKWSLGTPGRYFLPNLASHILLVGAGLGALLAYFKKEKNFEPLLLAILIGMFSFMMYLTFDVIILRFYF
jgi:hypothetical protein